MENLQIKPLRMAENQWLSDTKEFKDGTPNNYIIFKMLCGLGATHGECLLYNWYNSIILEPNTPVLTGKRDALDENGNKLYPNIFIVYKEQDINDVVNYLKSDIQPKKIMSTPEAYVSKVVPAIAEAGFDLFKDFFMLIDECDRMTKDVDYRDSIVAPIDDFFKFKRKAMISATAMQPSDPRFSENGFKILKVRPDYDYRKEITIIDTNNVLGSLELAIQNRTAKKIFIFLNGTNLIHATIKSLGLENRSKVYCAANSVKKLKDMGFLNASDELGDFAEINFLTSRFYSAVDIKIDEKPDIIIITDVYRSQFTMVDPYTDSTQIIGRFRNGYTSVKHISNFSQNIEFQKSNIAKQYTSDGVEQYKLLRKVKNDLAENKETDLTVINQALEQSDFKRFFKPDSSEVIHFLIDNYHLEQKVKSHYRTVGDLTNAYKETAHLTPKIQEERFNFNDQLVIELKENEKQLFKTIAIAVHKLSLPVEDGLLRFNLGRTEQDFRQQYPVILEIYDILGYEMMESLDFDKFKMKNCALRRKNKSAIENPKFKVEAKSLYKLGDKPLTEDVQMALSKLYIKFKIDRKAKSSQILEYYEAKPSTIDWKDPETDDIKKKKVWKIISVLP